ncbi:PhzF family phenazine biosynthesis protein [Tenacibaculum sp. 190524A02b]|uniref:PhzF family phenazine biosynthesis protein n=1 Tax=Tenacibaculum vairaonense TaxID=3137860 RepID=UPI0031FB699A
MIAIEYYLVDVFTSQKYGGNQLAVFIDFENKISDENMLKMARELNFSEITFIKGNHQNKEFDVRIFTPEYEVPFAGHPSLGTAYIISKYIMPEPKESITLNLKHAQISIDIATLTNLEKSDFIMEQAQPVFTTTYEHLEIANRLGLELEMLDQEKSIEEISTGLPYIIIPLVGLKEISELQLDSKKVIDFLIDKKRYKTNSETGLTTSLFFTTKETFEKQHTYNARMFCVENGGLIEDAATGSANGCFLGYLLKNESSEISAIVEQGFQMGRKSYVKLKGKLENEKYSIQIGGKVVEVSKGVWNV